LARLIGCAAGVVLLTAARAAAAPAPPSAPSGASEVIFICAIVLLLIVGRLLGEGMQRIGQPAILGQLIAGILLGPSVFGAVWPEAQHAIFPAHGEQRSMIDAVAQLGILMLLLLTGMETDLRLVRKVGKAAVSISIAGIALPFACGFVLGEYLPEHLLPRPDQRLVASLFLGTALSISSVKIVALIVREMDFMRRNVGQIIVASAIIDDSIGWIIIAVTLGLALQGTIEPMSLARSVLGTAAFLALSLTVGRRVVFTLIRWANDNFVSEMPVITTILVIMGAMALTTHLIGVHTVLGAFVAGVLVGQSPILTRHIDAQLRGLITALFAPVFFGLAGIGTDLSVFKDPSLVWLMVAVIAIASIGKFSGAFLGGRIGGLTLRESLALGCGMNARGSTEVIVATIGLSMGLVSENIYTVIVSMAVVTTMAMPPTLRWALARLPLGAEEKKRLEREAFEARGFVTNMERLLIAVDDSANGKFAARLAGMIAGSRSMPITLIETEIADPAGTEGDAKVADSKQDAKLADSKQTAESVAREAPAGGDEKPNVHVIARAAEHSVEETVAAEAAKGYDLMTIGLKNAVDGATFTDPVNRLAAQFAGPLAIADARGPHGEEPLETALTVLVPVSGTQVSREAAEVGIVIARAAKAPITALHVAAGKSRRLRGRSGRPSRDERDAIIRDVVEMAKRYEVQLRTAVHTDIAPEEAILRAARARDTLIVMGVNRRPGDELFFGEVAAAVLAGSTRSILFVSSPAAHAPPPAVAKATQGAAKPSPVAAKPKSVPTPAK